MCPLGPRRILSDTRRGKPDRQHRLSLISGRNVCTQCPLVRLASSGRRMCAKDRGSGGHAAIPLETIIPEQRRRIERRTTSRSNSTPWSSSHGEDFPDIGCVGSSIPKCGEVTVRASLCLLAPSTSATPPHIVRMILLIISLLVASVSLAHPHAKRSNDQPLVDVHAYV